METRRISLRRVTNQDMPILYQWRNLEKYRNFVHYNTLTVASYEDFIIEHARDSRSRPSQFVVESKIKNKPIGYIYSHTYSLQNEYCFLNIFIEETYEGKGYGIDALFLAILHLFETFNLHKVYLEVFEYNILSLSTMKSIGLVEEGRFKEHKMLNGRKYDTFRLAVFRSNLEKFKKILAYLS